MILRIACTVHCSTSTEYNIVPCRKNLGLEYFTQTSRYYVKEGQIRADYQVKPGNLGLRDVVYGVGSYYILGSDTFLF